MKKMRVLKKKFATKQAALNFIETKGFKSHEVLQRDDGYYYILRIWEEDDSTRMLKNDVDEPFSKRQFKSIARQLCYDDEVIKALDNAKNENEATRILAEARRHKK